MCGFNINKEQREILKKAMYDICEICPNEWRCTYRDGVLGCNFYMNNAEDLNKKGEE